MSKLTKTEVAGWIRNLVPYLENPMFLSPKGCFKETNKPEPGKSIDYDSSLIPQTPQVLSMVGALEVLCNLYKGLDE